MSGPSERDEIAGVLDVHEWQRTSLDGTQECGCGDQGKRDHNSHVADAIIASDWLAERDRRTAAAGVREVAEVRWELGEALVAIERVRTAQASRRRALSLYAPDRNPALEAHLDAIDNALSVCDEEPQ